MRPAAAEGARRFAPTNGHVSDQRLRLLWATLRLMHRNNFGEFDLVKQNCKIETAALFFAVNTIYYCSSKRKPGRLIDTEVRLRLLFCRRGALARGLTLGPDAQRQFGDQCHGE
jgi:hypothetical protein